MQKIIYTFFIAIFLLGCSEKMQKKIGVHQDMPDEYQAQRHKGLEVPPYLEEELK